MIPVFSFFNFSFVSVNEEREEKAQDSLATQYYSFSIIASKKKKRFQDFCYPSFHLLCFSSLTKAIVKSKGDKERFKYLNAEFKRI